MVVWSTRCRPGGVPVDSLPTWWVPAKHVSSWNVVRSRVADAMVRIAPCAGEWLCSGYAEWSATSGGSGPLYGAALHGTLTCCCFRGRRARRPVAGHPGELGATKASTNRTTAASVGALNESGSGL